jgi:hypothetical protein
MIHAENERNRDTTLRGVAYALTLQCVFRTALMQTYQATISTPHLKI